MTDIFALAEQVGHALKARKLMLAAAESCTGGGIGEAVTMVPGSSAWFERGFITYTNTAKREMLGVKSETLDTDGAVSEQAVKEMVAGALANSHAQVAVAVSGIAGPDGGTRRSRSAWCGSRGRSMTARRSPRHGVFPAIVRWCAGKRSSARWLEYRAAAPLRLKF